MLPKLDHSTLMLQQCTESCILHAFSKILNLHLKLKYKFTCVVVYEAVLKNNLVSFFFLRKVKLFFYEYLLLWCMQCEAFCENHMTSETHRFFCGRQCLLTLQLSIHLLLAGCQSNRKYLRFILRLFKFLSFQIILSIFICEQLLL